MKRLYEGTQLPFTGIFPDRWTGEKVLFLTAERNPAAFLKNPENSDAKLARMKIRVLVISREDRPYQGRCLRVSSDPDILAAYTDAEHPDNLFLIDEKGKILCTDYFGSADEFNLFDWIEKERHPSLPPELLKNILDAYPYEIVYADRHHVVRYMNAAACRRYGERVKVGNSLFNCHNERSREKIIAFLKRADAGEGEMFETYNQKTGEREFFVPVRDDSGIVTGYFERHEAGWDPAHAQTPVGDYWKHRV